MGIGYNARVRVRLCGSLPIRDTICYYIKFKELVVRKTEEFVPKVNRFHLEKEVVEKTTKWSYTSKYKKKT